MAFRKRILLLSFLDITIISLSVILAYLLRFDFGVNMKYFRYIPYVVFMHALIILPLFYRFKLYRRVWQYASIGELISILRAVTISEVIYFVFHMIIQYVNPQFVVPRSIYLLSGMLIIFGIGGSRFIWRIFRDSYFKIQPHHKRVLIVGAGDAGALIAKELKHSSTDYYPVAFIDDDDSKQALEVHGLPVIGKREDIPNVVKNYDIEQIIIAMPSGQNSEVAKIIDICKKTKTNIKILPRVSDIVTDKIDLNKIRDVNVEDLLGRDPVKVDLNGIADYVNKRVVLVTGAGGSIGSELSRQIAPFNPEKILLLGHGENSIYDIELELRRKFPNLAIETIIANLQDRSRVKEIFNEYKPNVVFHAAAHKHVPLMERNPGEAVKNNVFGTKNVAEMAHEYNASHFVMISTDKAVNPTSVMGATKRIAEMIVQDLNRVSKTKFVAVRFGNVLGSRGSVIPVFKQQIKLGGPVTVTHPEMVRYFMTIPEAVQLVIQAGALANGGEIFILDMGEPVKIDNLARDLIRLSGLEPDKDIKIIYTGIRPGEKLYEEILTDEEGTKATKHNRIFIGKPVTLPRENLHFLIKKLEKAASNSETSISKAEIRETIKQIVPTCLFDSKLNEEQLNQELAKQEMKLAKIQMASTKRG